MPAEEKFKNSTQLNPCHSSSNSNSESDESETDYSNINLQLDRSGITNERLLRRPREEKNLTHNPLNEKDFLHHKNMSSEYSSPVTKETDKEAIIRLNLELLKAKRNNWSVLDSLNGAYDEVRRLRQKQENLNNCLKKPNNGEKSSLSTEMTLLKEQIDGKDREIERLQSKVKNLALKGRDLKEKMLEKDHHLNILSSEKETKGRELLQAQDKIKVLIQSLEEKEQAHEKTKENIAQLTKIVQKKEAELGNINEEMNNIKKALEIQTEEVKRSKQDLKLERESKQSLEKEIEQVKKLQAVVKERELKQAREDHKTAYEQKIQLENELICLKQQLKEGQGTVAALQTQVVEWERISAETNAKIKESNERQVVARKEVSEYITFLEGELQRVKRENIARIMQENAQPTSSMTLNSDTSRMKRRKMSPTRQESLDIESSSGSGSESDRNRGSQRKRGSGRKLPKIPEEIDGDHSSRSRRRSTSDSGIGDTMGYVGEKDEERNSKESETNRSKSTEQQNAGVNTGRPRNSSSPTKQLRKRSASLKNQSSRSSALQTSLSLGSVTQLSDISDSTLSLSESESAQTEEPVKKDINEIKTRKRKEVLLAVFAYLTPVELCRLSSVSKEWKDVSEHPKLWRNVVLKDKRMTSQALNSIAPKCKFLQSLTLKGLKPRRRTAIETDDEYEMSTRLSLEAGLENILKTAGEGLTSLNIDNCGKLLSDRTLFLAGSHCRNLLRLVYRSDYHPASPEALWSLGSCKNLGVLCVPPIIPCARPEKFSDRSLMCISETWPSLVRLSIGGTEITLEGIVLIAKRCLRLQELELEHSFPVRKETAFTLCQNGFRGLRALYFTFTPVTKEAIQQFYACCACLEYIAIHMGISDYFVDIQSQESQLKYMKIVQSIKALQKRPEFARILCVKADYG